jgi:hypothetical protein
MEAVDQIPRFGQHAVAVYTKPKREEHEAPAEPRRFMRIYWTIGGRAGRSASGRVTFAPLRIFHDIGPAVFKSNGDALFLAGQVLRRRVETRGNWKPPRRAHFHSSLRITGLLDCAT